MDTTAEQPMVLRSPLGWDPVQPPERHPWLGVAIALTMVLGVVVIGFNWLLPYYALAPGSAKPVGGLIQAQNAQLYPAKGQVLLTTISLQQVSPVGAIYGWLKGDIDVVPADQIKPKQQSDQQYRQYNIEVMDESKQDAIVVALRRLGYPVTEKGEGAFIEDVLPQFAASGRLHQGEVMKAIDGHPVNLIADATAVIATHKAGDLLTIDVQQPDGTGAHQVQVPVSTDTDPKQKGKPILGVILQTFKRDFDTGGVKVDIQSGNIGGPSAGLAFTLGVIDDLTPGELTGGHKVAVTGTINMDGTVGDVGGVAQKTSAVRSAGAEVFLVPPGEYETAKAHAGSKLKVIKVTTLQDALNALGSLGGDLSALGTGPGGQRG